MIPSNPSDREPTVSVPVSKLLELMDKTHGCALPINKRTVMDWLAGVWPVETRMKEKQSWHE